MEFPMRLQQDRPPPRHPVRDERTEQDDFACMRAIAAGDRSAFERLYRRYYERVFRFSLRVTGRINLVEDIVNETMMVVWRRAREYRGAAAVSTWILGIAYRKSLKALARERRKAAV